jgi:hypothetical protein
MYQPFDDDDFDPIDAMGGSAAPDLESADSMVLWMHGLLEDPLRDSKHSEDSEEVRERAMEGLDEL